MQVSLRGFQSSQKRFQHKGLDPIEIERLSVLVFQTHRSLTSKIGCLNIEETIKLYREIGVLLQPTQSQAEDSLALQCVGLLLVHILSAYTSEADIQSRALVLKNIARSFVQSFKRPTKNSLRALNSLYKLLLSDCLSLNAPLSPPVSCKLLLAIELLELVGRFEFLLIVQAALNIIDKPTSRAGIRHMFVSRTAPFLPDYRRKRMTLVLDLDETLGHITECGFIPRPGVHFFIEQASLLYELVCFTAGSRQHADNALEVVDPLKRINFVLSKEHTRTLEGAIVKDLAVLGRNLAQVVIVDNSPDNFRLQRENGIAVKSWVGDQDDSELLWLLEKLRAVQQLGDVREKVI